MPNFVYKLPDGTQWPDSVIYSVYKNHSRIRLPKDIVDAMERYEQSLEKLPDATPDELLGLMRTYVII